MVNFSFKNIVTLIFIFFNFSCSYKGCSKKKIFNSPEEQLHLYITTAVNIKSNDEKNLLVDLTTGKLKSSLASLSEEQFKQAYIDRKYDFRTFQILDKQEENPKLVTVEFKIVYKSWNSGQRPERQPLIDRRSKATIKYEYGQWAIASVEALDSSFDWEVGMPLDNVVVDEESKRAIEELPSVKNNPGGK